MEHDLFQTLAISLGLGLLVGLQRQRDNTRVAGIRTFPLITLFGTLSGMLAQEYGGWVVAAGLISLAGIMVVANVLKSKTPPVDAGQTTEAAALLMFAVGAYLVDGQTTIAVTVGATVAVLLHLKEPLHQFVERIGEKDLAAGMQFVIVSLVILPVLPDRDFGPYKVLNPHNIWLMVVLIVGIGLAGYYAYKLFGEKAGTFLGGVLGGLISSTATTVSYARRSKKDDGNSALAALVIFIASTVSLLRIIIELSVVAPATIARVGPPLGAVFLLMAIVTAVIFFFNRNGEERMPEQGNPAQLKTALVFGAIYAAVILATAAAKDYLGSSGLYLVAIISGLTDVDAITLSTARLMNAKSIEIHNGWRIVLTAALSNIAFKGVLVGMLGGKALFRRIAVLFGISITGGLLVLWLWPAEFSLFKF
ncbi:MgtC/SapB family protein [Pontibacter ruber]|uniref:MgtC/SapB family protein n=1 Tax=Pontibacter ruber TaxID=1343895 RepID=A0ABW5CTZ4_9BACT|nr:MgtC/SapB family protein [Pontibacter ruber]